MPPSSSAATRGGSRRYWQDVRAPDARRPHAGRHGYARCRGDAASRRSCRGRGHRLRRGSRASRRAARRLWDYADKAFVAQKQAERADVLEAAQRTILPSCQISQCGTYSLDRHLASPCSVSASTSDASPPRAPPARVRVRSHRRRRRAARSSPGLHDRRQCGVHSVGAMRFKKIREPCFEWCEAPQPLHHACTQCKNTASPGPAVAPRTSP